MTMQSITASQSGLNRAVGEQSPSWARHKRSLDHAELAVVHTREELLVAAPASRRVEVSRMRDILG
jgi:hypothetical protein